MSFPLPFVFINIPGYTFILHYTLYRRKAAEKSPNPYGCNKMNFRAHFVRHR